MLSVPFSIMSMAATTSPLHLASIASISCRLRLGKTLMRTSTGDFWYEVSSCTGSGKDSGLRRNILYLKSWLLSHLSSSSFLTVISSGRGSFMDRFSGVREVSDWSSSSSSTLSSWSEGERGGGVASGGVGAGVLDSEGWSAGGEGLEQTSVMRARF